MLLIDLATNERRSICLTRRASRWNLSIFETTWRVGYWRKTGFWSDLSKMTETEAIEMHGLIRLRKIKKRERRSSRWRNRTRIRVKVKTQNKTKKMDLTKKVRSVQNTMSGWWSKRRKRLSVFCCLMRPYAKLSKDFNQRRKCHKLLRRTFERASVRRWQLKKS